MQHNFVELESLQYVNTSRLDAMKLEVAVIPLPAAFLVLVAPISNDLKHIPQFEALLSSPVVARCQ